MKKIRIGVSSCLLGEKVRFDGQHKHDKYITETLSQWFEFVPVCPEFELGLGVPRNSMRLEGDPEHPRLMVPKTGQDLTDAMLDWSAKRLKGLADENLHGFIFKSKSPSSGMERVKVYQKTGMALNKGRGIFANAFMHHFPYLPTEEEGRLHEPSIRENFFERLFTLKRWREMLETQSTVAGLVKFHSQHKYLIMAHSIPHYRELGRMVSDLKGKDMHEVQVAYHKKMMDGLRLKATTKKQVNVLQHMAGYFKKHISSDEKQELQEVIDQYHAEQVPLIVPITLINHYARKYKIIYLTEQSYLYPHPIELQLRNHV